MVNWLRLVGLLKAEWLKNLLFDWLNNGPADWLTGWLTVWLTYWHIHRFISMSVPQKSAHCRQIIHQETRTCFNCHLYCLLALNALGLCMHRQASYNNCTNSVTYWSRDWLLEWVSCLLTGCSIKITGWHTDRMTYLAV